MQVEIMDANGVITTGEIVKQYSEDEKFKGILPAGLGEFFLFQTSRGIRTGAKKMALYRIFPGNGKLELDWPLLNDWNAKTLCHINFKNAAAGDVPCYVMSAGTSIEDADEAVMQQITFWNYLKAQKRGWEHMSNKSGGALTDDEPVGMSAAKTMSKSKAKRKKHTAKHVNDNASLLD